MVGFTGVTQCPLVPPTLSPPRRKTPTPPCSRCGTAPASLRRSTPSGLPPPRCLHPAGGEREGAGEGRSEEVGGKLLRNLGAESWSQLGVPLALGSRVEKLKRRLGKQAPRRCLWRN